MISMPATPRRPSFLARLRYLGQAGWYIDAALSKELGWQNLKQLDVLTKTFPMYRFVDLFQAAERCCAESPSVGVIESQHPQDLKTIFQGLQKTLGQGKLQKPPLVPRDVAYRQSRFFPTDRFWVIRPHSAGALGTAGGVVRVSVPNYAREFSLEIASADPRSAEALIERIQRRSIEESIYRNRLLQVSFEAQVRDDYGEIQSGLVVLTFKEERRVSDDDIVLDDDVREVLNRNILNVHAHRDLLKRHGIPGRRGVLFYGPPGTGKTYTCQYLYNRLKSATALVVNGQALTQVKAICSIARMFQPSLLVLEDVDLIFAQREISLYSTALGDLFDELDGFQSDEAVTFLLTTNAIDRLEQAIKERPGRISQCVYFGPPGPELRRRYIARYLTPYDASEIDLPRLVAQTDGGSQAFIKELIYRAVQICLEDNSRGDEPLRLRNSDFETARNEITRFSEQATAAILGFSMR